MCLGAKGGAPGNENRVMGVVMCDYCHSLLMAHPTPEPVEQGAAREALAKKFDAHIEVFSADPDAALSDEYRAGYLSALHDMRAVVMAELATPTPVVPEGLVITDAMIDAGARALAESEGKDMERDGAIHFWRSGAEAVLRTLLSAHPPMEKEVCHGDECVCFSGSKHEPGCSLATDPEALPNG
jgi:hypothetical protein